MLLLRTEMLPEGPEWGYEIKLDGYRIRLLLRRVTRISAVPGMDSLRHREMVVLAQSAGKSRHIF
jgi:hypothetical protein